MSWLSGRAPDLPSVLAPQRPKLGHDQRRAAMASGPDSRRCGQLQVIGLKMGAPLPASNEGGRMITCFLRYVIDPYKIEAFESYARRWIELVNRFGGTHHGYFLPHEGANNIALALFSFPSLAAYEEYRQRIKGDPDCQEAWALAERTRCIVSHERSFMRPVL